MNALIRRIKEVSEFPDLSGSTLVELELGWSNSRCSPLTTQQGKPHAKWELMLCNLQKQDRVLCDGRR